MKLLFFNGKTIENNDKEGKIMSNPNNGGMGFLGVVGAIIVAVLILSFA